MKSKYDKLHNKYYQILSSKSGTRYERLAAIVFKCLNEQNTIIHDLKLIGKTGVKHQIDVIIKKNGKEKRVLIECKEKDLSEKKVGLGIIRNFFGVVDDIKPNEAFVITTLGFTRDAIKYAHGKGIKLAVLREFNEKDWEGRIKEINVDFSICTRSTRKVHLILESEKEQKEFQKQLANASIELDIDTSQPVFINLPERRQQFNEYIEEIVKQYKNKKAGNNKFEQLLFNTTIEVENRGNIPIYGVIVEFDSIINDEYLNIVDSKIAALILEENGGNDWIIFDDDLKKFQIDKKNRKVKSII